jgi:hypothetical protein
MLETEYARGMRTWGAARVRARFVASPILGMLGMLGALLVGIGPAGCVAKGAGDATFESKTTVQHDLAAISNVLVALVGGLDDDWRHGIQKGLAHRLASCRIRSTTVWPNGLELDFLGRARRVAQQNHASAILTIECKRSSAVDVNYETARQLTFELILIEPRSGKVIWLVESKLALTTNANTSDEASAERFAASIVSRLLADGVLPAC